MRRAFPWGVVVLAAAVTGLTVAAVSAQGAPRPGVDFVEETHFRCKGPQKTNPTSFGMTNQLETDTFMVTAFELLCVPAAKNGFEPVS